MKRFISIVLCLVLAFSLCGCSMIDYKKAVMLYEGGGYEGAKELFEALGDYEDSADYAQKAGQILDYSRAVELYAGESWAEAAEAFEALGDYEDSAEYLKKAQDELTAEKITGRWESEAVDLTELFYGYIQTELEAMGYTELSLEKTETFAISIVYTLEEYGLLIEELSEEGLEEFLSTAVRLSKEFMLLVAEQELNAVAEEYGISFDEVLASLEVSSVQEYLEQTMGMTLDELFALVYNEETLESYMSLFSAYGGTWSVKDGIVYFVLSSEMESGEYDAENDVIIINEVKSEEPPEDEFSQALTQIYPISFTRADADKPAA